MIGRAKAGEHHQLGGIIGAGSDQHFAPGPRGLRDAVLAIGDADGAAVLDQDAVNLRAGDDRQVRVAGERIEIGASGVGALLAAVPGAIGVLHDAHPVLALAVEIGVVGMPQRLGGEEVVLAHFRDIAGVRDPQIAAGAVIGVVELRIALDAFEVRQHVGVGPLLAIAEMGGPAVVVLLLAPHVDHGIDGAAAAEGAADRHDGTPTAELRLRHGVVHFEEIVAVEVFHVAGGHAHQPGGVARAALEDQHRKAEVPHEPHGAGRGGRAAAGDDEVVFACRHDRDFLLPRPSLSPWRGDAEAPRRGDRAGRRLDTVRFRRSNARGQQAFGRTRASR